MIRGHDDIKWMEADTLRALVEVMARGQNGAEGWTQHLLEKLERKTVDAEHLRLKVESLVKQREDLKAEVRDLKAMIAEVQGKPN